MRKNTHAIVLDTETANSVSYPLPYDLGFKVVRLKDGEEMERFSLCIAEIYIEQKEMMKSAYYAHKLPQYEEELKKGERKIVRLYTAKKLIADIMEKYNTNIVYAYNMNFDRRALNNDQSFVTENRYKYFFPYNTDFRCIWHMACQVLLARPSYVRFALKNNFVSEKGNILTNAECCYRYITKNPQFKEEHKGIDDVDIETEILMACKRQHKKVNTEPYQACWRIVQNKRKEMGV